MLRKFAKAEVLDLVQSALPISKRGGLDKFATLKSLSAFEDYRTDEGYVYMRVRAISSRVNKNHDGWPAEELKKSYRTFIGKPIFVDHHNTDPKKARGVVVDAVLHEEDTAKTAAFDPYYASAPKNHTPPTWIELLLEIDAKKFPKLAKAVISGDIDGVSMGANVERSVCSHCKNEAFSPEQYCKHIQAKGAYYDFWDGNGQKTSKKSYEDCYDIGFFEISCVFDPADETALKIDHTAATAKRKIAAAVNAEAYGPRETLLRQKLADRGNPPPQSDMTVAPDKVDTLRQEQVCPICGSDMEEGICEVCNYEEPPEGFDNPDLERAKEVDEQIHQQDADQAAQAQPGAPNNVELPAQPGSGSAPGSPPLTTAKAEGSAALSGEKVSATDKRINTQERPILPVTRKLTDKPVNQKTVKDSKEPVESNLKDKDNMTETQQKIADGASPNGEGVQAEKRVDVEGVGGVSGDPLSGIEHENVEKNTGDFVAPHTDTWSGNEGDSLGQQEPVTSERAEDLFTVNASEKTADSSADLGGPIGEGLTDGGRTKGDSTWDQSAAGFPDHNPSRVDLYADTADEVGERTQTDPNEAFRSQKQAEPVTQGTNGNDLGGPIGVAIAAAKAQQLKAFKVAETEIDLGLAEADAKFERVAELESKSEAELDAQLETLSKVKTAGLSKAAGQRKVAGRIPSLQNRENAGGFDITAHSVAEADVEDVIGW